MTDIIVTICAKATDPLYIEDNVIGVCSECHCKVQHRPHAPQGPKVCLQCAGPIMRDPETKVGTTREMMADFRRYLHRWRF